MIAPFPPDVLGYLSNNSNNITFDPPADWNGTFKFSYVVRDNGSPQLDSNVATVTVTINAVNDAPTASITPVSYSVNEGATLNLHGTGLSVADVDAGAASVTVTLSVGEGAISVSAGTNSVTLGGTASARTLTDPLQPSTHFLLARTAER